MRVLLTGAAGQLGQALQASAPARLGDQPLELVATGRRELDLADAAACRELVRQLQPDWVLNAGAYTAVDQAEQQPELAAAVNQGAPAALAEALAMRSDGRLLQLSTDFVFSGDQGFPYQSDAPVAPLGIYGATKAAGERAVLERLQPGERGFVLRTSWVYGPVGRNFCRTMLRLHRESAARGQDLRVVADQVGCPTSTLGLAAACWRLLALASADSPLPPILHWSDAGAASWYDFALAIGELGLATGALQQMAPVIPITAAEYPTPARRPSYSLLDCTISRAALGMQPHHWRSGLMAVIQEVAAGAPHTLA
jgi:dTDP-4-dehydrorhamnose reductase